MVKKRYRNGKLIGSKELNRMKKDYMKQNSENDSNET